MEAVKSNKRPSYKQLYEGLLNEMQTKDDILDNLEKTIVANNSINSANANIIESLESKLSKMVSKHNAYQDEITNKDHAIEYLKNKIPKDTTKDKNKLKGIRFQNGKFNYNDKLYDSVSEIERLNNG